MTDQPSPRSILAAEWRASAIVRACAALAVVAIGSIVVRYAHLVPIYDAEVYARCAVRFATQRDPSFLRCASHPTQAFILLHGIGQLVRPGSFAAMLVVNSLFALGTVGMVFLTLRHLDPGDARRTEHALAALSMAAHPQLVSSMLHINPDFGTIPFVLAATYGMITGRRGWILVGGIGATFTKESGVLLHAGLGGLHLVLGVTRGEGTRGERLVRFVRALPWYFAPTALYVGTVVWAMMHPRPGGAFWGGATAGGILANFLRFDALDSLFIGNLRALLLLQFMWIVGAVVVFALARAVFEWCLPERSPTATPWSPAARTYFAFTLAAIFLLTRVTFAPIYRYIGVALPMLVVCATVLASRWGVGGVRRAVLVAFVVLNAVSQEWSFDPVSRLVYGTFEYGSRTFFDLTRDTDGERGNGYGRDQLVYNAEIFGIHGLLDQMTVDVGARRDTVFASDIEGAWNTVVNVDPVTHHRTLSPNGVRPWQGPTESFLDPLAPEPPFGLVPDHWDLPLRPARIHLIELPNSVAGTSPVILRRLYNLVSTRRYEYRGMTARLLIWDRKPDVPELPVSARPRPKTR